MNVLNFAANEKIWVDGKTYLKPLNSDSFKVFYQLYSDSQLMKFIREPLNLGAAKKTFSKTLAKMNQANQSLFFYVIESTNGEKIGICGIKKNGSYMEFEIGVVLFKQFHNKNLSTKVKLALMNRMFSQSDQVQITAYCQPENAAPNHINEKLKFKHCGSGHYLGYKRPMNKWLMTYQQFTEHHL